MCQVEIKNCNNINNAIINIEEGTLNIKFAINGTGKSTIAKAIINQNGDLSFLKTFGKTEQPTIISDISLKNVVLFDSDFINNVVFNGSNVINNAFEVFIKNEKYDEQRDIINNLLYELRQQITGNEDVKKLDNQLSILTSKINYKKEKNTIDSRGMYSSIKSDKNIYNIPTELSKFSIFLTDKDKNITWSDWKNKGKSFEKNNICPYCAEVFNDNHEQENNAFTSFYTKANVSNLSEFSQVINNSKEYISEECFTNIENCIKHDIPSADKDLIFTKFMCEVTYLKEKINDINSFDSYKIEKQDMSRLSEILKDLRINYSNLDYFNNENTKQIIDSINNIIDNMLEKITDLQKEIGKINSFISSTIDKYKKEMNSFLKLAGFNYEFDIIKEGNETNTITVLKYISNENEKIQVDNIEKHLSWGEKNAFALVLFMYYALSKNPDLIILDDPISSFDGNKKYAIINRLFSNKGDYAESFHNKTVLMLTHDFEPIIDFGINHKPNKQTNICYLKNTNGTISEQKIEVKDDVLSTIKFYYKEAINESNNIISRICFLRKYLEHVCSDDINDDCAYNILSSIIHGTELRKKIDNDTYKLLTPEEIKKGETTIKEYIHGFHSAKIVAEDITSDNILQMYNGEINNYIKVQLFRVYLEISNNRNKIKEQDNVLLKFIDEIYHIENDYIFSLDLIKFDIIPSFIMSNIDKFMNDEISKK